MLTKTLLRRTIRPWAQSQRWFTTEDSRVKNLRGLKVHNEKYFEIHDKTGIIVTFKDKTGVLSKALGVFDKYGVNLTHIQSKPSKFIKKSNAFDFYIDFEGKFDDEPVRNVITELSKMASHMTICGTPSVPWFPTKIIELDKMGKDTLKEGEGIQMTDHPGFNDKEYKQRRNYISSVAMNYLVHDKEIPRIEYTENETGVWGHCYSRLKKFYEHGACKEHNESLALFEKHCGYSENHIPQLEDISSYLKSKTGWRLRPVAGLLSQREFLNGLAFKTFHSTQYIRHHSKPDYTPEPDIVHELMGHAPMFADHDFADFSQMIGLASLGWPEKYLPRLATIYWFTVEFGMCLEDGKHKAYGAGILSSFGEFEWALSDKPKFLPLDWEDIAENHRDFPISSVQPYYFLANSFADAKKRIFEYAEKIPRPFNWFYNEENESIEVDRRIKGVYQSENEILF